MSTTVLHRLKGRAFPLCREWEMELGTLMLLVAQNSCKKKQIIEPENLILARSTLIDL